MQAILVRGSGDVGSAVAHVLFNEGYGVVIHDEPKPGHGRRGMAFTDALFEGRARLAGVWGKRARDAADVSYMRQCRGAVALFDGDFAQALDAIKPDVVVDARMRKRTVPEPQKDIAPLSIGLGPNFEAGRNAHVAIETGWGDDLGRVIEQGPTRELGGEPRNFGGYTRQRFVYSPAAGVFRTLLAIGAVVRAGQMVGSIGDTPICAPMSGALRGLSHDEALVDVGTKIVEVDPRGKDAIIYGLGERPSKIARGVLTAIRART